MANSNKPANVSLTSEQVEELKQAIQASDLSEESKEIFIGLLSSCLWLQSKLAASTITIAQLKQIFGITTTEKKASRTSRISRTE